MTRERDQLREIAGGEEVITFLISRAAKAPAGRNRVSRAEGLKRMTRHFRFEVEALCAR